MVSLYKSDLEKVELIPCIDIPSPNNVKQKLYCLLLFFRILMDEVKNIIKKIKALLNCKAFVVVKNSKDDYIRLLEKKNKTLFALLEQIGFFHYHTTNKGWITTLHAIAYYIEKGWREYYFEGITRSSETDQCHHINGKVTDCSIENLVYLSPTDHLIVTSSAQKLGADPNHHIVIDALETTRFNKQGREIKNHRRFLVSIIEETIKLTEKCWRFVTKKDIIKYIYNPLKEIFFEKNPIIKLIKFMTQEVICL